MVGSAALRRAVTYFTTTHEAALPPGNTLRLPREEFSPSLATMRAAGEQQKRATKTTAAQLLWRQMLHEAGHHGVSAFGK